MEWYPIADLWRELWIRLSNIPYCSSSSQWEARLAPFRYFPPAVSTEAYPSCKYKQIVTKPDCDKMRVIFRSHYTGTVDSLGIQQPLLHNYPTCKLPRRLSVRNSRNGECLTPVFNKKPKWTSSSNFMKLPVLCDKISRTRPWGCRYRDKTYTISYSIGNVFRNITFCMIRTTNWRHGTPDFSACKK